MGGGDLNLKKSWHPQTLRNIERVWKAEQKYEAEQKKIEQLRKELQEERSREEIRHFAEDQGVLKKKNERLDWMYAGPAAHINREEYLLGRPADRALELLNSEASDKDEKTQPGAIFAESTCNSAVDLATKIREDPLFTIRKREEESKKELLNNPIRLKQLQQLLKAKLDKKDKKKTKKKKKSKKLKRHNSSESENDSTYLVKRDRNRKPKASKKASVHSSSEDQNEKNDCRTNGSELHHYQAQNKKHFDNDFSSHKYTREISKRCRHDSSSSTDNSLHKGPKAEGYGLITKNGHGSSKHSLKTSTKLGRYSRSHSRSPSRRQETSKSSKSKHDKKNYLQTYKNGHRSRSPSPKSAGKLGRYSRSNSRSPSRGRGSSKSSKYEHAKTNHLQRHCRSSPVDDKYTRKKHRLSLSSNPRSRSRSPISTSGHQRNNSSSQSSKSKKTKLNAEEMERLRQEMMANAKWRDEQLSQKVKGYREEVAKEEEYLTKQKQEAKFIIPMLSKAADSSTVENRIKRNIYNVQRTRAQQDVFIKR